MRRIAAMVAGLLAVAFGLGMGAGGAEPAAPATIEPFALADVNGQAWKFPETKALVVVFLGTDCPINIAFLPRLAELHGEYSKQGVQFVGINSNSYDSPEKIKALLAKNPLPFPVLKDPNNRIADRFRAERVPEAFLLDDKRAVRYRGRIDDQFGFDYKRPKSTQRDLAQALDELLDGKPISVPVTKVEGCIISRVPAKPASADASVTYTQHISRLMQQHCQECHRPGQVGPMALLSYDDAVAWSAMIKEVVQTHRMPPWHADRKHGQFANERGLSETETKQLMHWIDAGCPQGDPKLAPPAKQFAVGWSIGQPDATFEMKTTYDVPATMPKFGIPYKYFVVPTNFDEDRWVVAAEARPGAREVVHHIIVYVRKPGSGAQNREDNIGDGMLAAYAPGDMPTAYPQGYAKKLPKGAMLIFQMHYTPDGTARIDRSSLGLIFAKEPPKFEVKTRSIPNPRLSIAAGDDNYEAISRSTFKADTQFLSLLPHMHLRGKDFKYVATYPGGKTETLLNVPRYDFNWQSNYRLKEPLKIPAGTKIECTAHFDNSVHNKNNPDPTANVRWGDQTWEEMMIGFVDYAVELK